jgi:hypothetical protein
LAAPETAGHWVRPDPELSRLSVPFFSGAWGRGGAYKSVEGDTHIMDGEFRFSLLENGLDFLLSSLEHLTVASAAGKPGENLTGEPARQQKRHLKYALLHLCSSVELLFKVRLHQEHWSLVFSNVDKADKAAQDDGEFESVDFNESTERLICICKVAFSDEQLRQLKNLRKRRNQLEHFGAVDSLPAMIARVSSMVSFAIDFVEANFTPEQLLDQHALIAEIRSKLGTCSAFVEQRWKEISNEVDGFNSVIECPACQQPALEVEAGAVRCRFCCHTSSPDEAANEYIARVLGYDSRYTVENDGREWPLSTCPQCRDDTLVRRIPGRGAYCFNCASEWGPDKLRRCYDCNEFYPLADGDVGVCATCFRSRMEKE